MIKFLFSYIHYIHIKNWLLGRTDNQSLNHVMFVLIIYQINYNIKQGGVMPLSLTP